MRRLLGLVLAAFVVTACSASAATPGPSAASIEPSPSSPESAPATATAKPSKTAPPSPTKPTPEPTPTPAPTPTPPPKLVKPIVTAVTVKREGSGKAWTATFKKPVVSGIASATAKAVNGRIDALVETRLQGFAIDHGEPTAKEPSGLDASYSVAYASPRLLSLRFVISIYISGAAHPTTDVDSLSFDLRTGDAIGFDDLFTDQAAALGILSTQSRQALVAKFGADLPPEMYNPGTEPKAENFRVFALLPAGLEITFGDYQVGPHAIGTPAVVVSWSKLAGVLKPNGPIGELTK